MMEKKEKKTVDVEAIQRWKDGDEEAFEIIYKSYYQYIYFMAIQYFNDEEFAKDIVQETFLKAYKSIHSLETPQAFTVWIKRIAYTICHDKYKARKRDTMNYAEDDNDLLDIIFENEKAVSPTEEVVFNDVKLTVLKTLEKMKPEIRVIGYLRFFDELSLEEIADITGNSIGTVASRIARMKKKLQDSLKRKGYSSSCCAVITTPFLIQLYDGWVKAIHVPETALTSISSLNTIPMHSLSTMSKVSPYIAIATTMVASIAGIQFFKQSLQETTYLNDKITAIHYEEAYTNQPLTISVETKNNDYDTMLIDGEPRTAITQNGKHVVSIEKNGTLLDQQEVNITNIDKEPPLMSESSVSNDTIKIIVLDKGSGINYDTVALKHGDMKSVCINEEKGMFLLNKNIDKEAILEVYDHVGNMAQIKISEIEIVKRIH